jgi:hypothetical protein
MHLKTLQHETQPKNRYHPPNPAQSMKNALLNRNMQKRKQYKILKMGGSPYMYPPQYRLYAPDMSLSGI